MSVAASPPSVHPAAHHTLHAPLLTILCMPCHSPSSARPATHRPLSRPRVMLGGPRASQHAPRICLRLLCCVVALCVPSRTPSHCPAAPPLRTDPAPEPPSILPAFVSASSAASPPSAHPATRHITALPPPTPLCTDPAPERCWEAPEPPSMLPAFFSTSSAASPPSAHPTAPSVALGQDQHRGVGGGEMVKWQAAGAQSAATQRRRWRQMQGAMLGGSGAGSTRRGVSGSRAVTRCVVGRAEDGDAVEEVVVVASTQRSSPGRFEETWGQPCKSRGVRRRQTRAWEPDNVP
ncbi:hypothetical protein M422DRAFT_247316 [Sphaerobolus stellatus SS14]|nr:hypothetical protein M422DRAFT_247316 [Sphaerobolus stellatus SS14]